jgi:hypothetical protein
METDHFRWPAGQKCAVSLTCVGKSTHEGPVTWLAANRAEIWTAPFIDVAQYVKTQGKGE